MSERWLVNEQKAAEFLDCSVFALRQWRKKKRLPFIHLGRLVRFDLEALRAWGLAQQAAEVKKVGADDAGGK